MNINDYQELTKEEKDAIMRLAEIKAKNVQVDPYQGSGVRNVTSEVKIDDPEILEVIRQAQMKERFNDLIKKRAMRKNVE